MSVASLDFPTAAWWRVEREVCTLLALWLSTPARADSLIISLSPSHPSEQRYKTTVSEFFMIETRGGRLLVRSSAARLAES